MSTITEPHPCWWPSEDNSAGPTDGTTTSTSTTPPPNPGDTPSGGDARAIIGAARRLLADPAGWRKHRYAVDTNGHDVAPSSSTAVAWCLAGALMRACRDHTGEVCRDETDETIVACRCQHAWKLLGEHLQVSPARIEGWNDANGRDHGEVLGALDAVNTQLDRG